MLMREGEARSHQADRRLACGLALVAGGLNAAGFYAVGFFSGNMTGNVSALADHVAVGDLTPAFACLGLVGIFILGAATSTVLINAGRRRKQVGIYLFGILAEVVLLVALGCVDLWLPERWRGALMVFGLSFLMGLQNALVTRISNARVRTTHITGMVTDIGMEIANLLSSRFGRGGGDGVVFDRERLTLHVQTVIAFLVGGVIGVLVYRRYGPILLFGAAAFLLAIALPGLRAWHGARHRAGLVEG